MVDENTGIFQTEISWNQFQKLLKSLVDKCKL